MNGIVRTVAVAAVLGLAACGGSDPAATARRAFLVDARTGGTPGFWFLPPIAGEPDDATPNHRGLAPVVEVEELAPGTAGVVARLEEVNDAGAHYQVDWHASASPLSPARTYRIRVSLSGDVLGWADARVADDGQELQFLFSLETFPLTGARTLPIKFRIAERAPDADGDLVPDADDDCPAVPDPVQLDSDGDGVGDACECVGVVCAAPAPCHAPGACDPRTGGCVAAAEPDGTACDDGDPCTSEERCVEGACQPGTPLVCAPLDACHLAGACDPATGSCSAPPAPDGTSCPLAAGTGVCLAGLCTAPPPSCDGCGCDGCGCDGCGCGSCTGGCCGCGGMGPRWP
ncbi:MAG TPA: hypothetical protein VFL83_05050 [Anaeromyxobacter sp.]|nr:hypothetical protein [Anaeromyxobacter sp.]